MDNEAKAMVEHLDRYSVNTRDEYLHELTGRAAALIERQAAEIAEQCRVNGMGSEREAALMGKVARLEAEVEMLREALIRQCEGWENALELRLIPDRHEPTARILADAARAALEAKP